MSWLWGQKQQQQRPPEDDDDDESETSSVERDVGVDDADDEVEAQNDLVDDAAILSLAGQEGEDDDDDIDSNSSEEELVAETSSEQRPSLGNNKNHPDISAHSDDVSMIDDSSGDDSLDDDFLTSSSSSEEGEEENDDGDDNKGLPVQTPPRNPIKLDSQAPALDEVASSDDDDDDDDEQGPASFWEKQSLLTLAAEHDRVDILQSILANDDPDKERLMNSGIPPLHLSITFGSVHATVALLRMGADPSVRPNLKQIAEEQQQQPDDSKVEIPNKKRFEGISAWELTFGNQAYEIAMQHKKSKGWSLFDTNNSSSHSNGHSEKVMKPVDMPPSKREGIRHAFTAEALRCVGADEVHRLRQLLDSGMPASIDVGGKDLYGWAVEMGALQCEELLRPTEAAKYDSIDDTDIDKNEQAHHDKSSAIVGNTADKQQSSFIVHRPTEETVEELINRLDELENLSAALSTCLDNLAEEVSVCHGLLLMGGGATALASHVKSLKTLKTQKSEQLQSEFELAHRLSGELMDLVQSTGQVGKEISSKPAHQLFGESKTIVDSYEATIAAKEEDSARTSLLAQVAASENKIRKLRASIADLSEENARDMQEVQRRGLEGGINLVRGLREDIRDIDFQLSESRSMAAEFRTKMNMIHTRVPSLRNRIDRTPIKESQRDTSSSEYVPSSSCLQRDPPLEDVRQDLSSSLLGESYDMTSLEDAKPPEHNGADRIDRTSSEENTDPHRKAPSPPSVRIASGDSTAIALVQPGQRGFFTVDLWQVILRIIGLDRAAYRRGVQVASSQPNVMIV